MDYLSLMDRVNLQPNPKAHKLIGELFLKPIYKLRKLNIVLEGLENIPDEPVVYVMNHTDRFNYFPFQYQLHLLRDKIKCPYTAPWVKLKYYESKFLTMIFNWGGCLPMPSKGYLIVKDLREEFKNDKKLIAKYYPILKDYVDGKISDDVLAEDENLKNFINKYEDYRERVNSYFEKLMKRAFELCYDAVHNKHLNLLIFPEGTRSKRLLEGKVGAAQFSVALKSPIVPVGCNGSDKAHTKNIPIVEKNKTVVYRIGEPIYLHKMEMFQNLEEFTPFTESANKYYKLFKEGIDFVMKKLADLLDEEYKPSGETVGRDLSKFILK